MSERTLTIEQAKNFILAKQGLLGKKRFLGKNGILEYIRQAGCIQFDPVDACGKNADLTLQSRVEGYQKPMLSELLYQDRSLVDHFDKNLSIFPVEDWPKFQRIRTYFKEEIRSKASVLKVAEEIKSIIRSNGPVCSKDLDFPDKVHWYWSDAKLARVALEAMYYYGDLVIHHKKGTIKYYALAENTLSKALLETNDPNPKELDYLKWRVLRRIGAVGLLWNRHSDAFLFIWDMKTPVRNQVFQELESEGKIIRLHIEGFKDSLYCLKEDLPLLEEVLIPKKVGKRVEFLAPLDPFMWDRKLIKAFFNFEYTWEIYTVEEKRKFGYYVLPVLFKNNLIGRIEMIHDRKQKILRLQNIWFEDGWKKTAEFQRSFDQAISRFALFSKVEGIENHILDKMA
jgi:hypothetical protein